jgi:hypothetical protein
LLTDGGPASQRLAAGAAMVGTALMAILLLAWRRAPNWLLLAAFPLAALTVTAIAVLDPPLALTADVPHLSSRRNIPAVETMRDSLAHR